MQSGLWSVKRTLSLATQREREIESFVVGMWIIQSLYCCGCCKVQKGLQQIQAVTCVHVSLLCHQVFEVNTCCNLLAVLHWTILHTKPVGEVKWMGSNTDHLWGQSTSEIIQVTRWKWSVTRAMHAQYSTHSRHTHAHTHTHTHAHTRAHTHTQTHTHTHILQGPDQSRPHHRQHTNTHQHTPTHILTTKTLNTHSAKLKLLNEMLMSTGHGIHKLLSLLPCCGQLFVQANAPHTKRTQQLSESTLTEQVPHKGYWNVCYWAGLLQLDSVCCIYISTKQRYSNADISRKIWVHINKFDCLQLYVLYVIMCELHTMYYAHISASRVALVSGLPGEVVCLDRLSMTGSRIITSKSKATVHLTQTENSPLLAQETSLQFTIPTYCTYNLPQSLSKLCHSSISCYAAAFPPQHSPLHTYLWKCHN